MPLTPEGSRQSVSPTFLADSSLMQQDDEARSNGVVDTPPRENAMKTEDQASSSRPSRKAKDSALKALRAQAVANSVGQAERRSMRLRIPKDATPVKKRASPSARSKSARRGQERRKATAKALENIELDSTPYASEELVPERAGAESADIGLKSPESIRKGPPIESDFPESQVPTAHYQQQAEKSESSEDAAVKAFSPEEQVPVMDDQREHTTYESSEVVKVSAAAVDDQQKNERSDLSKSNAIETDSSYAQVPVVDNRQLEESCESALYDSAEPYFLSAPGPAEIDHRRIENSESAEDVVIESCSPFTQIHVMDEQLPGSSLPDVGMVARTPKRLSCHAHLLQSVSNDTPQHRSQSSVRANGGEGSSLNQLPWQRQETSLKLTVSDDYVSVERVETKESQSAARKASTLKEAKSPDQTSQLLSPPLDQYYVEETAWKKFNPPPPTEGEDIPGAVASEHLQPLPPAPPVPDLPYTGKCTWSFDENSRVLLGEFVQEDGTVELVYEDEEFLLRMMERDDITVISDGLATGMDPEKWTLDYIANAVGDEYYHKFRAFQKEVVKPEMAGNKRKRAPSPAVAELDADQRGKSDACDPTKECSAHRPPTKGLCATANEPKQANGSENIGEEISERFYTVKYREMDLCMSMKVYDFVRYMGMRKFVLRRMQDAQSGSVDSEAGGFSDDEKIFKFLDHLGREQNVDVTGVVLYMIDFDLVKLLPKLNEEFLNKFELPGCLPGGIHCMMNSVNINGRPFMGPNLYCTPPESFTQCHQDGHGTVDSGHLCLAGFNEVVMIRRLSQRHKLHALALLKGDDAGLRYDGLFDLPHGDGLGEKPDWPCLDAIENCRRMNYYPSTFILRPGQLVHINKGRLHMFRKLSPSPLPKSDCHASLRSQLLASSNFEYPDSFFCFSIAWDWMYRGVTSEGIYREVMATLECTILNRLHSRQSLAIPELSLLQMARTLTPLENVQSLNASSLLGFPINKSKVGYSRFVPSTKDILRGILPALRYVVDQHTTAVSRAASRSQARARNEPRVSLSQRPNSHENPQAFSLDPYGNGDFFCKLCSKELSNVYMHCDGCEILLTKDFNICVECWELQRFKNHIQMHPLNTKRHSTINHTGNFYKDRASHCPCKTGPICLNCKFCSGCSCKCHQWFTLHRRFFMSEDEKSLVRRVEAVVGQNQIPYSDEVVRRLEAAGKPVGWSSHDQAPTQGTKLPVMEYRNESCSSKKRKEGESKSDGPVAPPRTSPYRDRARDPPDAHPPKALPTGARNKTARNTVPRIRADNNTGSVLVDTKLPATEFRNESCSSKKRKEDETKSDGPVARGRTSRCQDRARDPPDAHPPKAPPTGVRKKAARNTVPRIRADNDSILVDFDVSQRPDELRAVGCAATRPVSRDDLSDGALAFTEPRGVFPRLERNGVITGFEGGHKQVHDFLEKARALDVRTPSSIGNLLPATCELKENQVRHLFRNFGDCTEIFGRTTSKFAATFYSRRELDILLYGHFKKLEFRAFYALMPYRPARSLASFWKERDRWITGFPYSTPYFEHLEKTVGLLLRMESLGHGKSDELDVTEVSAEPVEDRVSDEHDVTETPVQIPHCAPEEWKLYECASAPSL